MDFGIAQGDVDFSASVVRPNDAELLAHCGMTYDCKIVRAGQVIDEFSVDNALCLAHVNSMLSAYLNTAGASATVTNRANYYIGLLKVSHTLTLDSTVANLTDGTPDNELTSYDDTAGQRNAWGQDTVTTNAGTDVTVTNSGGAVTFTSNADSVSVGGAFTVYGGAGAENHSNNTVGVLLGFANFSPAKSLDDNDQLQITATYRMS